jgi:hypothetical protein
MTEPTIICSNCKSEIRLTQSLASPLIEETRREYEKRLKQQDVDIAKREAALREQERTIAKARESIEDQVAERLEGERPQIVEQEARKAKQIVALDLNQKSRQITQLQEILDQRNVKLEEAQKAQADLLRKQRELDDAKREMELTIERRVQHSLSAIRDQARKEVHEELKLTIAERELTITSMQKQIEELKRRAEQGSQQLQGEVQEIELEAQLSVRFPSDTIEPVPKGEHGGDVLQRVIGPLGQSCGTILWESKRTKNWSDSWLTKLRADQRAANAALAIVVTQALPKDVETFDLIDGVWVVHRHVAIPVAVSLRQCLVELAMARQASEGQQTKMEMVYQYLTGTRFRQRVQAIVEAFSSMQEDLAREKRALTKQWAKREQQIEQVMQATVGMYGDLQGIAGKTLQEIEGLEVRALEALDADERG